MKKRIFTILLAVVMIFSLVGCGSNEESDSNTGAESEKTYTVRYCTTWSEGSAFNEHIEQKIVPLLDEMSNGRIKIEVYPGNSIAGYGTALDAVKDGVADLGLDVMALYGGVYPYIELLETPGWIVDSSYEASSIIPEYMEKFTDAATEDMKIIAVVSTGGMGVVSTTPLLTAEDFKGFPLRATGPFVAMFDGLGGTPTVMAAGDTYESIKLNVLDGALLSDWTITGYNLQEVCDNYTYLRMCAGTNVYAMNRDFYESLPADLQDVVDEWSVEVQHIAADFFDNLGQEVVAPKVMEENPNFQYHHLDAAEEAKIVEVCKTLIEAKIAALNDMGHDGDGAAAWLTENYTSAE
jgi:TRAP-type C4-dicarboxylate transport system substrate-binding protein